MSTEFECMGSGHVGPQAQMLLNEACARFDERMTTGIDSDALAEPIIDGITRELGISHLSANATLMALIREHPLAFFSRSPQLLPSALPCDPSVLVRQNVLEWLDYELWGRWYASEAQEASESSPVQ